mmetsp:Transcript_15743/g.66319  ORF Transcript_15743/g.66319 Transcript_15743/m.66319 type:complete len:221 (-) Transcript_15743:979-1641(-)
MAPAPLATADRSSDTAFHMGELSSPPTTLTRGRAYGASMSSPRSGSSGAKRRARRAAPFARATAATLTLAPLSRASASTGLCSPVTVTVFVAGVSFVDAATPTLSGRGMGVTVPSSPSGVAATNLRFSAAALSFSSRRASSSSSGRPGSGVGSSTPHRSSSRNHSTTEGNTSGGRFLGIGERAFSAFAAFLSAPPFASFGRALAKATHSSARAVSGWSCP